MIRKVIYGGSMNIKQDINMARKPVELEQKYKLREISPTEKRVTILEENTKIDIELSSSSSRPVANKTITEALNRKVNSISGKGLSTNDFTDAYKNILDNEHSIDYITEIDSNSTWKWRKWASGRVELIGSNQYSGISMTRSSEGTYYGNGSESTKTIALPFTLSSVDYIGTQEVSTRSSGVYVYDVSVSGTTLSTQFRAHSSQSGSYCGVRYYIIGNIEES